jgi:hypothetical protein
LKKMSLYSNVEYELPVFILLALRVVYQPEAMFFSLKTGAALLFCALPAYICGRIIRGTTGELKKITLVFVAFFAGSAVSGSVLFLNSVNDFAGRGVFYANLFFVFCLVRAFTTADKKGEKWLIPLTFFACAGINSLFLTAYMPAILILLLRNMQTDKDKKGNQMLCLASIAAAAAGVLIFGRDTVFAENLGFSALIASNWKNLVYSLAITAPLLIIFAVLWLLVIRQSTDKPFKLTVALIAFLPLVSVFGLVLAKPGVDPVMAYLFAQFCFFAYFAQTKNTAFSAALKKFAPSFEKNPLPLLLVLVYLAAFSIFRFHQNIAVWIGA